MGVGAGTEFDGGVDVAGDPQEGVGADTALAVANFADAHNLKG